MHPVICQLGPFPIYSYGLMLAIAILVVTALVSRDAKRINVSPETVSDMIFWIVLGGILGARIFYVLLNAAYFWQEPFEILMFWKGGLAWQGSFIAGLLTAVIYLKKKKIPLWPFFDLAAPYLALGHAIGRIGCLLNGCCYGKPAAWGLYFPVWHQTLQPTQIYMSLGQLAIFVILRGVQPRVAKDGQVFVLYLMLSSLERFFVEFARADHDVYFGLSIFQYVCIGIFLVAMILNARLPKRQA